MDAIQFAKTGGPIRVDIRCGHAQVGWYSLTLWKNNKVAFREEGNFSDPQGDVYDLPGKASTHDGELLHVRAEIAIVPPITKYALLVAVSQGGEDLGTLTFSGDGGSDVTVPMNVFARLKARP
jgi:hypothetical protein